MDHRRAMYKRMLKGCNPKAKAVIKIMSNQTMEYAKWLNYIPDNERKEIEEISKKDVTELSSNELSNLKKFKKQQEMAKIFARYITDDCRNEDILPVYDFMQKTSLENIMKSKLSKEELDKAEKLIGEYSKLDYTDLDIWVKEKREQYQTLSMIEAYALNKLESISTYNHNNKMNKILRAKIEKDDTLRASYQKTNRFVR